MSSIELHWTFRITCQFSHWCNTWNQSYQRDSILHLKLYQTEETSSFTLDHANSQYRLRLSVHYAFSSAIITVWTATQWRSNFGARAPHAIQLLSPIKIRRRPRFVRDRRLTRTYYESTSRSVQIIYLIQ